MKKSNYRVVTVKVLCFKGDEEVLGTDLTHASNLPRAVFCFGDTNRAPTPAEWKEAKAQMENR